MLTSRSQHLQKLKRNGGTAAAGGSGDNTANTPKTPKTPKSGRANKTGGKRKKQVSEDLASDDDEPDLQTPSKKAKAEPKVKAESKVKAELKVKPEYVLPLLRGNV